MKTSNKEYEVQTIMDKCCYRGKLYYKIKWKNYSIRHSTWEPVCHLKNAQRLIRAFERKCERQMRKSKRICDKAMRDLLIQLDAMKPRFTKRLRVKSQIVSRSNSCIGTPLSQSQQSNSIIQSSILENGERWLPMEFDLDDAPITDEDYIEEVKDLQD